MRSAAVSGFSMRPDDSPVGTGTAGPPVAGIDVVGLGLVLLPPHAPARAATTSEANRSIRTQSLSQFPLDGTGRECAKRPAIGARFYERAGVTRLKMLPSGSLNQAAFIVPCT